jgi:NitT/TauT family transport system substrate-binding protein
VPIINSAARPPFRRISPARGHGDHCDHPEKVLFSIFSRPEITRIAELKGKLFGATRFGTLSDFASRVALEKHGLNPERDVNMVQTGGQPETVLALLTGKVQGAALSVPATMRAQKGNMRELFDMAKLDSAIHQNGVVTTRKYLKTNEDTVRRFLRAYIEGAALAKKDKLSPRVMANIWHQRSKCLITYSA